MCPCERARTQRHFANLMQRVVTKLFFLLKHTHHIALIQAWKELKDDFQLEPCRPEVSLVCNHTPTNEANLALLQCKNYLPQASCLIKPAFMWIYYMHFWIFLHYMARLPCTEWMTESQKALLILCTSSQDEEVTLSMCSITAHSATVAKNLLIFKR